MYVIKKNGRGEVLATAKTELEAQRKCMELAEQRPGVTYTYEEE